MDAKLVSLQLTSRETPASAQARQLTGIRSLTKRQPPHAASPTKKAPPPRPSSPLPREDIVMGQLIQAIAPPSQQPRNLIIGCA
ncbi:hypothetical protein PtA15_4A288 [Puccinia triticina]|uniref:Uncharacterized protein n=1 Tax=Puccinia triticina TaxID=208348 RepID=A0ABY7CFI1_9BASI|nr:uncharacterized protein PtA15_4A288 [Puccinia triticina]WAQ83839.1 hypothetical protein PtA15_4A288 [Puccinia triticina]